MKNVITKSAKTIKFMLILILVSVFFDLAINLVLPEKLKKKIGISLNYSLFSQKYHHEIASNIGVNEFWGNKKTKIYTDKNSFRILKGQKELYEMYDNNIAFVGDSFVWGSGVNYEDHFISQLKSDHNYLNLGYVSYSPSIYFKKIEDLLINKKISIKKVFLFIDTSDIWDEGVAYREDYDGNIVNNFKTDYENTKKVKKYLVKNYLKQNSFFFKFYEFFFRYYLRKPNNLNKCLNDNKNFTKYLNWEKWRYSFDKNLQKEGWVKKGGKKSIFYIAKIARLLEENNAKLILVLYPSALEVVEEISEGKSYHINFFKSWAKKNSIEYINFYKSFNKYNNGVKNYKSFYILCDLHWNEEGHQVVGKIIDKYLSNVKF